MDSNYDNSVFRNFVYNFIKTLSTILFPVITFIYASRVLGTNGIGKVNFAKSIASYYSMLAVLGMNFYGTREVAKRRHDKKALSLYVQEMLLINGIMTFISYVLLIVSFIYIPKLNDYGVLIFVNSSSILLMGMGMEWLYQGLENYKYISIRAMTFQVLSIILMFVFVRSKADVVEYSIVYVFATSGSYILNFLHAREYVSFKKRAKYRLSRHLKPLLWLFMMSVSIELYTVMDSTMLGFIQNDDAVGKYTAAVKVNKLVITLITSLGVVLIPRLSYYAGQNNWGKLEKLVQKSYQFIFLFSVPAAVGLYVLSYEIILLFSGRDFFPCGLTMRILTPIVLVIPFSVATNQQMLIPLEKEKKILKATCMGATVNFVCNWILIPKYAENGAAIATVFAEFVVAIISYNNAKSIFEIKKMFGKYYQYWMASVPIIIAGYVADVCGIKFVAKISFVLVVSVLSYLSLLFCFKNQSLVEILIIIKNKLKKG